MEKVIQIIFFKNISRKNKKGFQRGDSIMLYRACFRIEGDWRPFKDGILWETRGATSPVENYRYHQNL